MVQQNLRVLRFESRVKSCLRQSSGETRTPADQESHDPGGRKIGFMGTIADALLAAGGEAIVVILQALLRKEVAHRGLTELQVVAPCTSTARMAELSDTFIALSGGFGTLDEFCEVLPGRNLVCTANPAAF